jgi:hypothetical protein
MHHQNELRPTTPAAQLKQTLLAQAAQQRRQTVEDKDVTAKQPQPASHETAVSRVSTAPSWSALND